MAQTPQLKTNRHDTHSTTTQGGSWSTKRIATLAVLCTVGFITSFIEIPIFPLAAWLKFDPSGIVALVAGFAFGPGTGVLVAVLTWFVHLLFVFDPYGVLMAILSLVSLVAPASAIYRHDLTLGGAVKGMIVGGLCSLIICVLANLVVTPLYTAVSVSDVAAMIVPILIPFNLIKIILECVGCALIYKPISKALSA
ncbi:MAG: ECF transporter S component [Olegusella sp.]|nr:ECF transporter S component [Olegusella sp.]